MMHRLAAAIAAVILLLGGSCSVGFVLHHRQRGSRLVQHRQHCCDHRHLQKNLIFRSPAVDAAVAPVKSVGSTMPADLLHFALSARKSEWFIWWVLSAASATGLLYEKTRIGELLSAPLITMAMCLLLCNIGVLPTASAVYDVVLRYFVPLAVPLLLFDANLRRCFKTTGRLMKTFIIGSFGTLLGTIVAYLLVPMRQVEGAAKIAAALCARHIGGAVNFVAVADIVSIDAELVAAALAADNLVVAFYFTFLFLVSSGEPADAEPALTEHERSSTEDVIVSSSDRGGLSVNTIATSLSITWGIGAIANICGAAMGMSPMLLLSGITVVAATLLPHKFEAVVPAGNAMGVLLMQMFFSVTGAKGHIPTVMRIAPSLLLHTSIQIAVHFLFTYFCSKLLLRGGRDRGGVTLKEIVLASNANVGGPTTASAMASNKGWKGLVLPALLTGIFGLSCATQLGIGILWLLRRMK